jgi:hypothetical protein
VTWVSVFFERGLPLSCGQRVTFFAGAKKVTKETPLKEHDFVATEISEKDCRGPKACRRQTDRYQVTRLSS